MRLQNSIRALSTIGLLATALFVSPAKAQCGPDGLQGPCCLPTFPTLPVFPDMPGLGVRWVAFNNCAPVANTSMCARIFPPAPKQFGGAFLCGQYDIPVRVRQCGLNIGLWAGTLNGDYSRNWQEVTTAGTALTVWRFIVNGDLKPSINVPNNQNFKPACQAATTQVYFTGYIDYALDCATNTWQVAWMLTHECDGLHHTPTSARPAPASGYHPSRSYTLVGPGTGFVVSATNPLISKGPVVSGATRHNDWAAAPMVCNFEEPLVGGSLSPSFDTCLCNSTAAGQYSMGSLFAGGACGSQITPSIVSDFGQKRLGTWTNPNVFPGVETLLFDFGHLDYFDGCNGVLSTEWFEGVETIGGFPAVDFTGVALGRQFEDVMSCNKSATSPATLVGAPHVVNYVLNFNLP